MKKSFTSWLIGLTLVIYPLACAVLVFRLSTHPLVGHVDDDFYVSNTTLPDFSQIQQAPERIQLFLDTLRPLVDKKNLMMLTSHQQLVNIKKELTENHQLSAQSQADLENFRNEFSVTKDDYPNDDQAIEVLLLRVDVIPSSMVLAQAAIESGWGTSFFAQEGNNLFGEWCYKKGCGIVPTRRAASATYEVRKFDSIEDSISSYFYTINTHYAYRALRDLRAKIRNNPNQFTGSNLVVGLEKYSGRGSVYVSEVRSLIRNTGLENPMASIFHPEISNELQKTFNESL